MHCQNCGYEVPPADYICPNCGAPAIDPFDSKVFKRRAKEVLRKTYWPSFGVSLLLVILTVGLSVGMQQLIGRAYTAKYHMVNYHVVRDNLLSQTLLQYLVSFLVSIFLVLPLHVGWAKFYLAQKNHSGKLSDLFYAFGGSRYLRILAVNALMSVFIFLWSLLLLIPGIIAEYAYFLVPYILAENPRIGIRRAISMSREMTAGFKGGIFYVEISFVGWQLLGLLCLGVGILFVQPYYYATLAEMYVTLRNNALKRGICLPAELGIVEESCDCK